MAQSAVECLTEDLGVVGLSLTGDAVLEQDTLSYA